MIRWLHISDLHIKNKADWRNFQKELESKCLSVGKIDLVIATGDFHDFSEGCDFSLAKEFLQNLINSLGLDIKKDLFVIPGNHDGVTEIEDKKLYISAVRSNPMDCNQIWIDKLFEMFVDYERFVKDLVPDYPVEHPAKVHNRVWNNEINFIHCNTSIGADGANKDNQLLDIDGLASATFYSDKPNIILAHNSFFDLNTELQKRVKDIIRNNSVCAYLCGDKHIKGIDYIVYEDKQRKQIPCVVSYKSAPAAADNYSTFGIIIGEWEESIAKLRGWMWKSGVGFTIDQVITEKEINMSSKNTRSVVKETIAEKNFTKNDTKAKVMSEMDISTIKRDKKKLEYEHKQTFIMLYHSMSPQQIEKFNRKYKIQDMEIDSDINSNELYNYVKRATEKNMIDDMLQYMMLLF